MTGADLERATAAIFQASGWFVFRGATDPTHQAFELDVLGYRFDDGDEYSIAAESKSGKSGFGDLWKLNGLKAHLAIDRGVLLADSSDPLHGLKTEYAKQNNIVVLGQNSSALASELVGAEVIESSPEADVLNAWIRCFRVEDGLIKTLIDKDLWAQYETIRLAKEQLQHLTSRCWLERDPWRQAAELYKLYSDETKIARRMAEEINGGGWEHLFKEAVFHGASPEIQACFYLEHRKRLAVAFAATRCAAQVIESSPWEDVVPSSFRSMVNTITEEEAWYLPPVLQVYFLGFGGMICSDAEEAEREAIAAQAGCEAKEVKRALELFEELFPYSGEGGWFYDGFELSRLKLLAVPIRGAGTWMREAVYCDEWDRLGTAEQLKVVGRGERACAAEAEQRVLQRRRRFRTRTV